MELYGSLSNISGSVSASYFTGSYIGDGAGLYNLPASGVTGLNLSQIASGSVTASVTPDGLNVNTSTSITGSLNVSGTVLSQTTPLVSGSSQINITGTTGYSTFSSSITATDLIQDNKLISLETASSSIRSDFNSYTSSNNSTNSTQNNRLDSLETSSGSLNSFTSSIDTTIKNKLNTDGVISGSSQILNGSGIVSSSTQVTTYGYATTGSNLFIGTQTHSGSILPSVDNTYDLGSSTYQWRDVYISSGSLYVDGTKVLSSTAQELTITTDTGQSIKILEGTTDSIVLQTADGDIELKSSADGDILLDPTNGKIMLKGPVEILNGNKIQSSVGGTPVVFANDILVSGSIDITGTIEGINLTDFSSSLNSRLTSLESSGGSLNSFTASANTRLNALESTTGSLNTYTSSNNTRLGVIETSTGSLNSFTSSTNTRLSSIETTTASIISVNTTQNNRLDSLETTSGSILSTNTTQNSRLDSIEGKTGSYATTGSNIFMGNQTITGSLYISQDLIIAGSSSVQHISSSVVNIADNIITVNAQNPSIRFGGLAVIDSGSSPQVSGSMLFDSVNNQWLFVHQNQGTITSSVLLMGPETYDNLGNESYITANRLVKSTGIEHLTNSNISDDGTTVTILSNAVVNGTFSATGTTLVSGSSQINHNTTTNYVVNEHINHTSVSISAGNGLSGGGDISSTRTLSLDTTSATFTNGVKTKMNTEGVVSGSSQITYGSISGIPSGIVSGSSQISYTGLSNIPSGIVSGSSQVSFTGLSNIPGGIVSGSAQVDLTATTNYSTGIKTRLNAEGVLSGSAQVVAALPAGTVSGSAQVSITSTTGFSTYLDQAVKSGSTVTFNYVNTNRVIQNSHSTTLSNSSYNSEAAVYANAGAGANIYPGFGFHKSGELGIFLYATNRSTLRMRADDGNDYKLWHDGNLTNLNQLTNGPGYITSYTETDTLANVTARGATTSTTLNLDGRVNIGNGLTRPSALNSDSVAHARIGGSDVHLYVASLGAGGGYKVAVQAARTSDFVSFDLDLQSNGGTLRYGGNEVATRTWVTSQSYLTSYTETDTLATVTARGASTSTALSLSGKVTFSSTVASRPQFPGGILGLDTGDGNFDIWGISRDYYPSHGTSANAWGLRWNGDNNDFEFVGGGTNRVILDMDGGNITSTGTVTASSFSGTIAGSNVSGNISGNAANITSYTINQSVGTGNSPTFSSVYSSASGGFYLGDTGAGLYRDNTYDVVLTQNNSSGGVTYISGAGNVIISIDNNNNETDRKFIVGSNAIKASNELFSVNESGTVYVGGYLTVNGAGSSSTIYMSDSDEGNREIHCNSNRIGFLNQSSSWGAYCDDSGNWFSDFSMRAPIFYDSQDTGYYVDPNGTSNIYTLTVNNQVNHNTSSSRAKYHVYGSDGLYVIGMQSAITYGGLNDWGMTFQFNNESDRGFWWGHNGHSTAQGAMALTTNGNLTVARRIRVGYGESDTSDPTVPLQVYGSGGTVVDIQGSAGQLFSVTDDLTGDIFAISDISGVPMINVNTTNGTSFGSTIFPSANNAYDLGTSSFRWANVYTNDLHLSNEGKVGGNDIDGTTGNWTIQEGADQLYIINNNNGKKYKIDLTEVK